LHWTLGRVWSGQQGVEDGEKVPDKGTHGKDIKREELRVLGQTRFTRKEEVGWVHSEVSSLCD
jgi:hypothetical protein